MHQAAVRSIRSRFTEAFVLFARTRASQVGGSLALVCLLGVLGGCEPAQAPSTTADPPPAALAEPTPQPEPVVEATSLLGVPLARPEVEGEFAEQQQALLVQAEADLATESDNLDARIWVGRRQAYLGRFGEAIATYTEGLAVHGDAPRLLRHRGHRRITLRQLEAAIEDLEHGAMLIEGTPDRVEEDGLPNPAGIPTSSLHTNTWYHLGLAHYLRGDFLAAEAAYRRCHEAADNDDMRVAATYWLVLSLRRLDRDGEARRFLEAITADLELLENHDYKALLLLWKGEGDAEALLDEARQAGGGALATLGYGIGAWHFLEGRSDKAQAIWQEIVDGDAWPSFGHIAAEAELARGG